MEDKKKRVIGRVLATELSDSELHEVAGGCSAEGGEGKGTTVVHHTGADHHDCHVESHD